MTEKATAVSLAALARNVLFTRRDAPIHLRRVKAEMEIRKAENEFWGEVERAHASRLDEERLAAVLIEAGMAGDQARRWSLSIVRSEDDDEELDLPPSGASICNHCASAFYKAECGVCGQPRGSKPSPPLP